MIVILHNIRSIYNVGSIFRSADALGSVEKIYLCGITPAPVDELGRYRQAFSKTALGAEKTIVWKKKKSTRLLIQTLKAQRKYRIVAVEQDKKSVPYFRPRFSEKDLNSLVLVMGEEINGLPREILDMADTIFEIPMLGKKESLNVGIAFSIVAFQIMYNITKH